MKDYKHRMMHLSIPLIFDLEIRPGVEQANHQNIELHYEKCILTRRVSRYRIISYYSYKNTMK